MSEAKENCQQYIRTLAHANEDAFRAFCAAADLWRRTEQPFSAGFAMSKAVMAAWGSADHMFEAKNVALQDFQNAIESSPPDSLVALAAIHKLRLELSQSLWMFQTNHVSTRTRIRQLDEELAQRLWTYFRYSEDADSYLVKGLGISTDLDGDWNVQFPEVEIMRGSEYGGDRILLQVSSAFHLFVDLHDWFGANEIVNDRPSAFTSHGLRGWRAVVRAHCNPADAVRFFDEASDEFGRDKPPSPEELHKRGGWSGVNEQLWSKYFRARARVLEAIQNPAAIESLISSAAHILGDRFVWHDPEASRFRILIQAISTLVSDPAAVNLEKARDEYLSERRISNHVDSYDDQVDEYDQLALMFITETAKAITGFQNDPASELTKNRLRIALDALGRIPSIGSEFVSAVEPAIGKAALSVTLGPVHTWMHRALANITDEKQLQRIILRLLQAGLPRYAQVRHGPLEFGKDIVALVEIEGELVLHLYQLKCGDINKKKWRESKDELEEMFLIPVPSLQLPETPARVEGILLCNGHALPFVEPVMEAWLEDQQLKGGRDIKFRHLDWLVDWIADQRLVNELKLALKEEGIGMSI